jgi:hypothetical protein
LKSGRPLSISPIWKTSMKRMTVLINYYCYYRYFLNIKCRTRIRIGSDHWSIKTISRNYTYRKGILK